MQELEENSELREGLKTEVTETYGLINMIFQSIGFFTKVFSETLAGFASYFDSSGNKNSDI